jgi:hypothetical protein
MEESGQIQAPAALPPGKFAGSSQERNLNTLLRYKQESITQGADFISATISRVAILPPPVYSSPSLITQDMKKSLYIKNKTGNEDISGLDVHLAQIQIWAH